MPIPLRILTVVGARPQFIKAAALSRAVANSFSDRIEETILHTGQHYDTSMSEVFFTELGIPTPAYDLHVGSASHGVQTARMLEGIEKVVQEHRPDVILIYGDTNSTLAAALAGSKCNVPVAHVEAGLRSFDRSMPEEVNRVVADHCSTWLFCPTTAAVENLRKEGIVHHDDEARDPAHPRVVACGDVMYDNSLFFAEQGASRSTLQELGLDDQGFFLATVHRAQNTDDPERLLELLRTFIAVAEEHALPVVLPMHPRTRDRVAALAKEGGRSLDHAMLKVIEPVGFLDMARLESASRLVLTDSGGVQKEAYFHGKPCVVLRSTTEWVELVEHGQAILCDADSDRIVSAVRELLRRPLPPITDLYGDGHAAERICSTLLADR